MVCNNLKLCVLYMRMNASQWLGSTEAGSRWAVNSGMAGGLEHGRNMGNVDVDVDVEEEEGGVCPSEIWKALLLDWPKSPDLCVPAVEEGRGMETKRLDDGLIRTPQ